MRPQNLVGERVVLVQLRLTEARVAGRGEGVGKQRSAASVRGQAKEPSALISEHHGRACSLLLRTPTSSLSCLSDQGQPRHPRLNGISV